MDRNEQRIEAIYLTECTPQSAYNWLYERRYINNETLVTPRVLEYLLSRRNDNLIDLGLAYYGHSSEEIRRIFYRGNIGIRCAALSNANVGTSILFNSGWLKEEDIEVLIDAGSKAELESLAKNRFLNDDTLERLIERKKEFSKLSDDQFSKILLWLSGNRRLSTDTYDESLDGPWVYDPGRIFDLVWNLARSLEVTKSNAFVLGKLLRNTNIPSRFDDPDVVLKRWLIEEEGNYFPSFYFLRSRLADVLKADTKLLNSNDCAVRESFYRRFSIREFEDPTVFIKRDGEVAFGAIVENDEFWCTEENREKLRELAEFVPDINSSYSWDTLNTYNSVGFRKRRQNPGWFSEEYVRDRNNSDYIIQNVDKKIDMIIDAVNTTENNENKIISDIKETIEEYEKFIFHSENKLIENYKNHEIENLKLKEEFEALKLEIRSSACGHITPSYWSWMICIILLLLILLK